MNKSEGITEVGFSLQKLYNTNILENGSPCNTIIAYHVTVSDNFMHLNPTPLSIRNVRMV